MTAPNQAAAGQVDGTQAAAGQAICLAAGRQRKSRGAALDCGSGGECSGSQDDLPASPSLPSISELSDDALRLQLTTQAKKLGIRPGQIRAVAAPDEADAAFWLLLTDAALEELEAPVEHGGQMFLEGALVVKGRWLERCGGEAGGPRGGPYEYFVWGDAIVYSNHVFGDCINHASKRRAGKYVVYGFDMLTEEMIKGHARAHAECNRLLASSWSL